MSWTPKHSGEVLVSTLTGQPSVLNSSSGVVQVPIDPSAYGIPVTRHIGTEYRGIRVVLEFTLAISNLATGWFGFVYLGDRAYDPEHVGSLSGYLQYQFVSSVSQAGSPYSGVLDFEFDCAPFPDDSMFAIWNGRGARTLTGIADEAASNLSLGHPGLKSVLDSAFVQVYMGQGGTSDKYPIQVTRAYVSEYPTTSTPVPPPPPRIYPPSGSYTGVQMLGIVSDADAYIRYTTDGTDPTITSKIWSRGFRIWDGMTVKAIAVAEGDVISAVASATYSITGDKIQVIPSYRDRVLPYLLEQYKGDNA